MFIKYGLLAPKCATILLAVILEIATATVHVRRLDDETLNRLKRRASENNRSLESEARHILQQAVSEGMAEQVGAFRTLSRNLRQQQGGPSQTPGYVLIREDRDGGHEPS